ncbi:hypothetical protein KAR91_50815 [Candidatus Pacearchaeota archaeon]|nr:hypothetical protein [Candidatus Pacearchaeota archaeon]
MTRKRANHVATVVFIILLSLPIFYCIPEGLRDATRKKALWSQGCPCRCGDVNCPVVKSDYTVVCGPRCVCKDDI